MLRRIIKPHRPEPVATRELESGQRLKFERRPTEWEGWLWCEVEDGIVCWVPEGWVTITKDPGTSGGTGWCFLKRDYDPAELTVNPGDGIDIILAESGWVWGTLSDGHKGWVPAECVEPPIQR